jgi:mono/diheme cytochrome c family protein
MTTAAMLALGLLGAARTSAALSPGVPAQAPSPPAPPSFAHDVAPIFDKWCISCHGEKEAQGGLRLDSYEAVLKGGDDGPVLVPGDAESQLLGQIERRARPPMPPKKRLPRDPVATVRAWIVSGAGP